MPPPGPCLHLAQQLSPSRPQEAQLHPTPNRPDPRVLPGKGWLLRSDMQLGMGWREWGPQALALTACLFGCLASFYRGVNLSPERWRALPKVTQPVRDWELRLPCTPAVVLPYLTAVRADTTFSITSCPWPPRGLAQGEAHRRCSVNVCSVVEGSVPLCCLLAESSG